MYRFGNGTRPHLVTADATQPGDFGEDDTSPDARMVSNAVLYRLLKKLNRRMSAIVVAMLIQAAALFALGLLLWWSRPR